MQHDYLSLQAVLDGKQVKDVEALLKSGADTGNTTVQVSLALYSSSLLAAGFDHRRANTKVAMYV